MSKPKIIKFDLDKMVGVTIKGGDKLCTHGPMNVFEDDRTLQCDTCKCYLDPFDYLVDVAHQRVFWFAERDRLTKEARRSAIENNELRREEKRIKARIKRAKSRAEVEK